MRKIKERRKCSKYQPLFFLLFEIFIYLELAYIAILIFGKTQIVYIFLSIIFIFLIFKSVQRFSYVQKRCKQINAYKKYQEKLYTKMTYKK